MSLRRLLPAVIALSLLAGCGFHLAGTRPLPQPLQNVRIDMVAPYRVAEPPVETSLRNRLQRRGSTITEKSGEGVTVIRLSELQESERVLSVGADGKALELQLILRITYDVRTADRVWSAPDRIEVRRDFSFNAQQVLAKEQEADRLREFMQDEMAELLLLRMEAAARQPAATAPPPAPPAAEPPAAPPDAAPVAAPVPPG